MSKMRLDELLCCQGYAEDLKSAGAIIMSGNVFINGQRSDKAGTKLPEETVLDVRGQALKYV
ncbi:MAG: S4 domain-containing protein, partial [Oscillospiraceae bacterium]